MSDHFVLPLVSAGESRRPFSEVVEGDLLTVNVYNPATQEFDQECGARFKRAAHGNIWIQLCGLTVPEPYQIGDNLVIRREQVVDW